MKEIVVRNEKEKVKIVRNLMLSSGNLIGSVHFIKRSDGSKRKMSYRLRVQKPTYAKAPSGKDKERHAKDSDNGLITIFDCNSIRYDKKDRMNGRGGYKSIPLAGVYRVKVGGEIYRIRD
jgi:hypothetical protein